MKTVFPIPNIYHSFQEKDAFFSPPFFSRSRSHNSTGIGHNEQKACFP
ncbi:hypothetical protein HMPREF3213_01783 [Heyndrickxia coagulans]|uniref:Uncharacterized protein n=1 Tax=Heyndrickxia coagulans TaxID=1398 RepID=A0A133KS96_HEYCO|nr:hypothetical protein HMPREF3213_01783 [Heyndrickxia coagulans]